MQEKYGFIYIWRDRKHKRYYVGSHWGTEDDGYVCSSPWMLQAYKRRPEDFKRRVIKRVYSSRKDLREIESTYLQMIKEEEIKVRYYNLNIKGTGHWSSYPEKVKTIREKVAHTTKEAMWRPDVRENYERGLETRYCRSDKPEVRKKRSKTMKNTLAKKDIWPLNDTKAANRAMKGSKRLFKDGMFKTAKPESKKWNVLLSEGWRPKD